MKQGVGRPRKGKGVGKNSSWRLAHSFAGEDSEDEPFSDEGDREEVEEVATVVMVPSDRWDASAPTDEDSDREDEDPSARGIRLPRNLLTGEASLTTRRQNLDGARARQELGQEDIQEEDTQEEDTQEEESQEEEGELEWEEEGTIPPTLCTNIPTYSPPVWSPDQEMMLEDCKTALDWYELFSSRQWLDEVVEQSRLYAISRGRESQLPLITPDNIR